MPYFSVIIPVYGVEKYINRCVDSILSQTFQDYELILIDDGSPDKSGEICDNYATQDTRIRVIHKKNGGLSSARNAGIDVARGDYLFFVDSDDAIHPNCLEILEQCIRETGAEIAIGEFTRFTEKKPSTVNVDCGNNKYSCKSNLETLHSFFDGRETLHSLISACGKLWKRDLFDKIRFPVGRLFEDEFTTYKLYFRANKTVFVDANLYYYFINEEGITRNLTLQKRFDEYDAQWERMVFFREKKLNELLGKAAVAFLKTAQWDLIACRKGDEPVDNQKKKRLEQQYSLAFQIAKGQKQLDFLPNYDYYVLAQPQRTLFWRIKRQILLRLRRKE